MEYPYSKYTAAIFETKMDVIDSKIVDGKEIMTEKINQEESKLLKTALGKNAFEKSIEFNSNLIEVSAFTWTL